MKDANGLFLEAQFSKTKPGDFGIFGDPIQHSLSPAMQNAALAVWALESNSSKKHIPAYHAFLIKPDQIERALHLAQKYQLVGLNITVPHKEKVVDYLPWLDEFADQSKSVNTISLNETGLKGYNTDGFGFETAVRKDLKFDPHGKTALILGAGGTGRVLLNQLILSGIRKVFLWNRSGERAAAVLGKTTKSIEAGLVESPHDMKLALSASDLVVNATAVGLKEGDGLPAPGLLFSSSQCFIDVVYHRETEFLKQAWSAGAKAIGGLGMLLYQGARAFEIWTKSSAPLKVMKKALVEKIKGKGLDSLCQFDI